MAEFSFSTRVCMGEAGRQALGALKTRRVFVVTDGFLASSGLLDWAIKAMDGAAVEVFDRVEPDPSLQLVADGVARARAFGPDAILAFGGGSPMDCAKGVRWFGWEPGARPPLYAVPTTAGTGSEVTRFAVLTDTERGVKHPMIEDQLAPQVAILEPSLLAGVPPRVTAETGMDVLTHAAEAFVAKDATPFTDALALSAFAAAFEALPAAHRGDLGARGRMLTASTMAGLAFDKAGLGVCHALSHALGGKLHLPHGRLNAILLPHVIRYNTPAAGDKYARLSKACGLTGGARALAGAVSRLAGRLGIPSHLEGTPPLEETVRDALADPCAGGNPGTVTGSDLKKLLLAAARP